MQRSTLLLAMLALLLAFACVVPAFASESEALSTLEAEAEEGLQLEMELEGADELEAEAEAESETEEDNLLEADAEAETETEAEVDAEAEVEVTACAKAAKSAQIANRRARAKSIGRCAAYVADAIIGAGIRYTRSGSAKDTPPQLRRSGYSVIPNNSRPQAGDVIVIQPIPGHPHGHMEIFTGKQWVSDFRQVDKWPGSAWRNNQGRVRYSTFRLTKC